MKVIMKSIFLLALILSFMNCQEIENTLQESSQNLRSNNQEQQIQNNLDNNLNETQNENNNNIENNNNEENELDEDLEEMTKQMRCVYDTVSNCSNQSQPVVCQEQLQLQMKCFESKCSAEELGSTAKEHVQVCFDKYCKTDNQDVINVNNQLYECLFANKLVAVVISLVALIIMF